MWLSDFLKLLRAQVQAYSEPLPHQAECQTYAADALNYCISLYGQPSDPKRPYDLAKSSRDTSSCSYGLGRYTILISRDAVTLEQLCLEIAHEMYHRVTMHRKGLRRKPYADEVLAFLTSLWFLEKHGFKDYAGHCEQNYTQEASEVDVLTLKAFRRPAWYQRLRNPYGSPYPEDFGNGMVRLAVALKRIASGDDLCRLIKVNTLDEWIASLPKEGQYGTCRILEVPSEGKQLPETISALSSFRQALKAKGDRATAVAEFQRLADRQPENGNVFFYLARIYGENGQPEAALDAYLKAESLGFSDCWLPNNVGNVYWHKEEYVTAAEWFQKAVECKPEWAHAHYWLGLSLSKSGRTEEARQAWEKVLTLGDEEHQEKARKALEDNPSPDVSLNSASDLKHHVEGQVGPDAVPIQPG